MTSEQMFSKWTGWLAVIPAIYLPLYNQFLHGDRDASSIVLRSGFYAEIHIVAAICCLFAIYGLFSIYLKIAGRSGVLGFWAFIGATLAQGMYAGELFIDGFFNPMLAHYDPYCRLTSIRPSIYTRRCQLWAVHFSLCRS